MAVDAPMHCHNALRFASFSLLRNNTPARIAWFRPSCRQRSCSDARYSGFSMELEGEGDSRWLVAERPDGQNVGQWHWEEVNKMQWSRARLTQLLVGIETELDPSIGHAALRELNDLQGEAFLTMRKGGKKFAVFDLTISLKWEGKWGMQGKTITGDASIGEFASINDEDEYTYNVSATGDEDGRQELIQLMQSLKVPVFKRLQEFTDEMQQL